MKIFFLSNVKPGKIGGGWSFYHNFRKCLRKLGHEYTDCGAPSGRWDVAIIPGATLVERYHVEVARMTKCPIVLRVDGIPEDWRNRGTGWPRLRDYAKLADVVVYQSQYCLKHIGPLLGKEGPVIYNGIDTSIFKREGPKYPKFGNPSLIHVNFRKDPNKRWDEVITRFRDYKVKNPEATITFIGNYPTEIKQWKFGMLDWKAGKDWQYLGIVKDRQELAKMLRSGDYIVFPSFADPCPNTLIEAMACGLKPIWINNFGGQQEIVEKWNEINWSRERMTREYLDIFSKAMKEKG